MKGRMESKEVGRREKEESVAIGGRLRRGGVACLFDC